ncbi:DMT family transporter [Chloroflexota bacterium]
MEIGLIFAILAAICLAGVQVSIRRGTYQLGESVTATAITVAIATIYFSLSLPATGGIDRLLSLSPRGFILLGAVGVINYVGGRFFLYSCIRHLGANKSSAMIRLSILFAVAFSIVFLQERVTALMLIGALGIMFGATLVSFGGTIQGLSLPFRGVLFGLGSALCGAISSIMLRLVMPEIVSPFAANFVSFCAAFLCFIIILALRRQFHQLLRIPRSTLGILFVASISSFAGHSLRYAAYGHSPVSVVQPLLGTMPIFVLLFSFIMNRKIDVFTWRVVVGIVVIIIGAYLISLS